MEPFVRCKRKKKRKSRRVSIRHASRKRCKLERSEKRNFNSVFKRKLDNIKFLVQRIEKSTIQECLNTHGFVGDPAYPLWHNTERVLLNMTGPEYFSRPQNMTFHDLCTELKAPEGIGVTLGIGLKFCIQDDHPKNTYLKSFARFQEDVWKQYIFAGKESLCETPKKIYVKSTWIPDPVEEHVESRISKFSRAILAEHNFLRQTGKKSSNLSIVQKSHLNLLRSNKDFVVLISDKNLGPAIMERSLYIKSILNEHLMDTKTYAKINENEAFATMKYVEEETWKLIDHYSSIISKEEREYFRKSFPMNKRVPQFYGMPKVHKNKLPMPFRPVVSQCGSVFGVISIFADFKLQSKRTYSKLHPELHLVLR